MRRPNMSSALWMFGSRRPSCTRGSERGGKVLAVLAQSILRTYMSAARPHRIIVPGVRSATAHQACRSESARRSR
ncbi:hypothetical protein Mapa_013409 [Marchantia paleacea]|nr:hypothetical protein Mapa_013409 [Marchantia paleacea]